MHRVQTIDRHGDVTAETVHDTARRAALTYMRRLIAEPEAHLRWVGPDVLPGMPETVHAERFGNPCEQPCCVPLADEWNETGSHRVIRDEREERTP